jgi:hypothetical protein
MEENKKYHFVQGENKLEMTIQESITINESRTNNEKLEFDVNWYLSHGYTLLDDIEKSHQL